MPGRSITRPSTSRRCCAAPKPPASTSAPGEDHSLVRAIARRSRRCIRCRAASAPQVPPRAPARPADRAGVDVLSGAGLGMLVKHVRVAKAAWGIFRIYRRVAAIEGRALQRPGDAAGDRGRHLDARTVHPQPVGARRGRSRPQGQDADRRRGSRPSSLIPGPCREAGVSGCRSAFPLTPTLYGEREPLRARSPTRLSWQTTAFRARARSRR